MSRSTRTAVPVKKDDAAKTQDLDKVWDDLKDGIKQIYVKNMNVQDSMSKIRYMELYT